MKRKGLDRSNWARVDKSIIEISLAKEEGFNGFIAKTILESVNRPLIKNMIGKDYCIADSGYTWVQYVPLQEKWCLTTMFDSKGEIVQWYFDITKENGIDSSGNPFYDDLYLDVIVLPSSEILLIDEDDLKEALNNHVITRDDYDLAYGEANKIISGIAKDLNYLHEFSKKAFNYKKWSKNHKNNEN